VDEVAWNDIRTVLDEEICRLPEKYRAPVILCFLEGKTNAEAARQLGCPCGTIVTRLAWARRRLHSRLVRRGVDLTAGSLAVAVSQRGGIAAVPASLLDATMRSSLLLAAGKTGVVGAATVQALQLSRTAMNNLVFTRAKLAVVVFSSLAFAAGGAGLLGRQLVPSTPVEPTTSPLGPVVQGIPDASKASATESRERGAQAARNQSPAAEETPPQDGKRPRNELLGFLQSVDAVKRTLSFLGDDGVAFEDRTLSIKPDVSITWNGKSASLADLKPGCKMILTLSANGTSILAIQAKEGASGTSDASSRTPALRGTLKLIDPRSSITVTIQLDGKKVERTLPLADAVQVEIDGTRTSPADLKPGMAVWLKLSRDRRTVGQIMVKRAAP
jgi:hypothetical protein